MYSENNRRNTSRRADNEFLRRMLGGELTGDGFPVMSTRAQERPQPRRDEPMPPCNQDGGVSTTAPSHACNCPTEIPAPSIAMVYAPRQCWRNLLDPASGLAKGSIFSELILPLGAVPKKCEKEVNPRRPF